MGMMGDNSAQPQQEWWLPRYVLMTTRIRAWHLLLHLSNKEWKWIFLFIYDLFFKTIQCGINISIYYHYNDNDNIFIDLN